MLDHHGIHHGSLQVHAPQLAEADVAGIREVNKVYPVSSSKSPVAVHAILIFRRKKLCCRIGLVLRVSERVFEEHFID